MLVAYDLCPSVPFIYDRSHQGNVHGCAPYEREEQELQRLMDEAPCSLEPFLFKDAVFESMYLVYLVSRHRVYVYYIYGKHAQLD